MNLALVFAAASLPMLMEIAGAAEVRLSQVHSKTQCVIQVGDLPVVIYQLVPPPGSSLPLPAGGYFHPFRTPAGETLTDFSPGDHRHHRGVFLAWVEMHGEKDADFWGWGEHAPVKGRAIENVSLQPLVTSGNESAFRARNHWKADGAVLIEEELEATFTAQPEANVLDLKYRITPRSDLTLSRWAFSGFCLRARKEGTVEYFSPKGPVSLPNPSHLKPESDWPDERWYACVIRPAGGQPFGGAVLNHPANPPTLWHNHRDIRMINPCIVAPGAIELKKGAPLILRYKVAAFDGTVPSRFLNTLAADWK